MKKTIKTICLISVLILGVVLSGCGEDKEQAFTMQEVKTYKEGSFKSDVLGVKVIRGSSALAEFVSQNSHKIDLSTDRSKYVDSTICFEKAIEKYDSTFFENSFLAIDIFTEGTTSATHKAKSISEDGSKIILNIQQAVPDGQTLMECIHILICELPNEYADKNIDFKLS